MSLAEFSVNGVKYKRTQTRPITKLLPFVRCFLLPAVTDIIPRDTTLATYIRSFLSLPGTKVMCKQGGCGVCIVSVRARRWPSGVMETFAVNSCMVLVYSCNNWEITTIEGLGNRLEGYNEIQKRIAAFHGTQCGYCTPGWVMAIHSFLNQHPSVTMAELEKSFGSNTCRCTGYRPILDTVKSFAIDADPQLFQNVQDIEDLKICSKTKAKCDRRCSTNSDDGWVVVDECGKDSIDTSKASVHEFKYNQVFVRANTVDQIFAVLRQYGTDSYMFVDGNTAKGIEEYFEYPNCLISMSDVIPLKQYYFDQNLVLGANISLEHCIQIFKNSAASRNDEFSYLKEFAKHFEMIAHVPVRNIGSLAGNLMTKHKIPYFQSDVFILFACVGAMLTIQTINGQKILVTLPDFLRTGMKGKLIMNVLLPPFSPSHIFCSYKIKPRNQNSLAIVNAAFLLQLNSKNNTVMKANMVYGNISPNFIHAEKTEKYLVGNNIFDENTIQTAIKILNGEIIPEQRLPEASPECRKKLAVGIFYKFILSISPPGLVPLRFRSGGTTLNRPLSRATQNFQTDPSLFPLNQPLPKYESLIQSSGEARYANDIPPLPREVFGAFVLSTIHVGEIDDVDTVNVLNTPGVVAVYTAKDIPGKNSFICPALKAVNIEDEEILISKDVKYYGQPVAIVVATSEKLAEDTARKVLVRYKNISTVKPVLSIDAAKKESKRLIPYENKIEPKGRGNNVTKVIKGIYEIEGQYFYYLEPITTVVVPVDQILEVYDSTQWPELSQAAIAQCLNMKESDIIVKVRRLGGGFGGKITRNIQTSAACALVARKLNRPCRFILPMQTNMITTGKRLPCQCEYEVGVDDDGKIQYLNANIIEDKGYSINNKVILEATLNGFKNCYDYDYFSIDFATVFTDLPCNTSMRAPGTCEGIACIEHIMEHIAFSINKDINDVRKINTKPEHKDVTEMIEQLKQKVEYEKRENEIIQFNKANRWMKKAIQTSIMTFSLQYNGVFTAVVSIYRVDGSVTVTTGGVEMGQGLNTKVRQVCAFELGIPVDLVTVISSYTFTTPNNQITASSLASECVCYAVIKTCEILNGKIAPVKQRMPSASWQDIIKQATYEGIGLSASYSMNEKEPDLKPYTTYGAAVLEVQLDVLTGRFQILRADILEDVGLSMNPVTDVGQVEGAFVQGLGYFTSEKLVFDNNTGKLLTNRSLNYLVPLSLDIPADFRVEFRYNSRNPMGVLGSKAVGEMGVCTAYVITHALRKCIQESRKDSGLDPSEWINIDIPYTTASILKALGVKLEEMVFVEK